MKNRGLLLLAATVLVIALGVAACAPPVEEPPIEQDWQWPERLLMASASELDPMYAVGIAWTTPFSEDTGVDVRIVLEGCELTRWLWLRDGRQFIGSVTENGLPMMKGDDIYATRDAGPFQLRLVYPYSSLEMGFFTTRDSGIRTPYDIKPGTRIAWMTFLGERGKEIMLALLAWADIDPDDVIWVAAGSRDANFRLVMDGRADVSFAWTTTSPMLYEAAAAPRGLRIIELNASADPEGAKRFHEHSDLTLGVMSIGVPEAIGVWGIVSMSVYQTYSEQDPELVYRIVKWLNENHDRYKDAHESCAAMTLDNLMLLAETSWQPLHDGTVRYLEELGMWTPAHEARRQQNIDQITRYVDAYLEAIEEADEKGIKVDPANQEWLDLWYNYRDKLPTLKDYFGLD